ncbi:MAG: hypothetical protein H6745_32470 [Deltaproteobacteria bacterium]|nr:hypothetical protein [Deltaproteobacteria bacterium]
MRRPDLTNALLAASCALLLALAPACGDDGGAAAPAPLVTADGALNVAVVAPAGVGPGLADAVTDLRDTLRAALGATVDAADPALSVTVALDGAAAELGDEGYRLATSARGDVTVTARTEVGAMYGLYDVAADLGARWIHPEEAHVIPYAAAALPDYGAAGVARAPAFARRGYHHHTQHPIVASDVLLRPGDPSRRELASHLIRWMARNRQNTLSFHMLKTVDLAAWAPYMADIAAEAGAHGVEVGCVLSFVDQQQNNFRLVEPTSELDAPAQIAANLDRVLAGGLRFVTFQIGTSEFTKPDDDAVVTWLDAAMAHLRERWPGVRAGAWIHIPCDLLADDGGYFYHLPLRADLGVAGWVHTTMFYAFGRPAPVYSCEDFDHQLEFVAAAEQQGREQVFLPETAWWLGFDDNLPLALPITGRSREEDIARFTAGAAPHAVTGHVTFTTGREWTYWQYDHYLTRATWDASLTWDQYVAWLAPVYGARAEAVKTAVKAFTDRQVHDLYDTDALLVFYLAGELPQDELGEAAGILARRPKLSFQKVLAFDDDAHAAWLAGDIANLGAMRDAYAAIVAAMPAPDPGEALYAEQYRVFDLFVKRIEQTLALYAGVDAARAGDRPLAEAKLAEAEAITADVMAEIHAEEAHYRDAAELLYEEKPESLTSYPFGYLWETHTGYFWTRRNEQLARVIAQVFDGEVEAWVTAPDALLLASADDLTVLVPESDLLSTLLKGFVPQLLVGLTGWDEGTKALTVVLAQDRNLNALPDAGTELALTAHVDADGWAQTAASYPIAVYGTDGTKVADLPLLAPELRLTPAAGLPAAAETADLAGEIASETLTDIIVAVAGIDRDGIGELIKGVWGIPTEAPLPERLPIHLRFALHAAEAR